MPFAFFQRRTITPTDTKDKKKSKSQNLQFSDDRDISRSISNLQNKVDDSGNVKSIVQLQNNIDNVNENHNDLMNSIEILSGQDMSDVNVNYNSKKPAEIQADAYAKGNDIHLGPGQEKHLPHEAWHVVQQKQNRVKPTLETDSGELINNDPYLEKEADLMGQRSLQEKSDEKSNIKLNNSPLTNETIQFKKSRKKNGEKSDGSMIDTLRKDNEEEEKERKNQISSEDKKSLADKRERVKKAQKGKDLGGSDENSTLTVDSSGEATDKEGTRQKKLEEKRERVKTAQKGKDLGGSDKNSTLTVDKSGEATDKAGTIKKKEKEASKQALKKENLKTGGTALLKAGDEVNKVTDGLAGEGGTIGTNSLLKSDEPLSKEDEQFFTIVQNTEMMSKMFSGVIGLVNIMSGKTPLNMKSAEDFEKFLGSMENIAKGASGIVDTAVFVGKETDKGSGSSNDTTGEVVSGIFAAFKSAVGAFRALVDLYVQIKKLHHIWNDEKDSAKKKELGAEISKAMLKLGHDGTDCAAKIAVLLNECGPFTESVPIVGSIFGILKSSAQNIEDMIKCKEDHDTNKKLDEEIDNIRQKWSNEKDSSGKHYEGPKLESLYDVERIKSADKVNQEKFKHAKGEVKTKGTETGEYNEGTKAIEKLTKSQKSLLKDFETLSELKIATGKRIYNEIFRISTNSVKIVANILKLVPEANTQAVGIGLAGGAAAAEAGKAAGGASKQFARDKAADPDSFFGRQAARAGADTSRTTSTKKQWRVEQVQNIYNKTIIVGDQVREHSLNRGLQSAFPEKVNSPIKLLSTMLKGVSISDQKCAQMVTAGNYEDDLKDAIYNGITER